jgi:hypothetical protein
MGAAMIGESDAGAEERAELLALRDQAALRRKELGETVTAITGRLAGTDPRAWARQAASAAARRAGRAARTTAARTLRRHRMGVTVAAAGGCLLVTAVAWRGIGRYQRARPWPRRRRRRGRGWR